MGYVVMSVYSINAAVVWWKHVSMYYDECKKKVLLVHMINNVFTKNVRL